MLVTSNTTLEKQTKTQVLAWLRKHGTWRGFLIPSECAPKPGHPMNMGMDVTLTKEQLEYPNDQVGGVTLFDRLLNEFKYYNCNSETGWRVHFHRIVEADE